MVRLMLVLAPVMCILSGIGASSMLSTYMTQYIEGSSKVPEKKLKKNENNKSMKSEVSWLFKHHTKILGFIKICIYLYSDCNCICCHVNIHADFICIPLHLGYF